MPKNTIIPAEYGGGVVPPIAEQSIRFDRTRATLLHGYSPGDDLGSDLWTNSGWFKITNDQNFTTTLWSARQDANNFTQLQHSNINNLTFTADIGGVTQAQFRTNRRVMDSGNWYHIMVVFGRTIGQLDLYVNGYLWPADQFVISPVIANVAGYSWLDSSADHAIGGIATPADHFSGEVAEFHASNNGEAVTAFGQFNSAGVWEPITYLGVHGARGFYMTFGRTADLGEDFSGNGNDLTLHDNGGSSDQMDDWMERNYCIIDVHNLDTLGGVTEAGLDLAAANGRVTMQPAANTGVWYYERNGVGVTWDTGVSGRFDPLLTPASYNFGQSPFVGVGPGGGELTLCSPNLPASDVLISRDHFAAIGYEGDGASPRVIASPAISQGDAEYANIVHRSDLVWVRNMELAVDQQQSHRLRAIPNQLIVNDLDLETAALADGFVSDLLATGFEVTAGGATDNNTNNAGELHSATSWRVSKYAQNLVIIQMDDNAEEEVDNPASGNTDTSSSDLELVLEGADPEQEVGLRYQDVLIPQGATVIEARIQFEADDTNAGANDLLIFTEDIDDAPVFVDAAANFNITLRTKATPGVAWTPAAWNITQERATAQLTTDFAARVQDVIDRGGWTPGNSLVIIFTSDPGGTLGEREAEAWNAVGGDSDRNTAMLQVAWDDGGIDTGMSLFTYVGAGKVCQVMHGLGAVPEFFAIKRATGAISGWNCYHSLIQPPDLPNPEDGSIAFNSQNAAIASSSLFDNTPPDATFITLGAPNFANQHEDEYVGWAMREVEGFSKVFNYTGNGATNGPSVYFGFKARWVIIKSTDSGNPWFFNHRAAGAGNPPLDGLFNQLSGNANLNSTLAFGLNDDAIVILSHGIRIVDTAGTINNLNSRYVGIAFAEAPFKQAKASI